MRIPWAYIRISIATIALSMALIAVVSGTSFFVAPVTEDLGISRAAFLGHYSLYTLLSIITMPIVGRLEQRFGARRVIIFGGVWTGLGLMGMSLASEVWMFYLFGALIGLTLFSTTTLIGVVLINTWFSQRRGLMMGLKSLGGVSGIIVSNTLPPFVAAEGWRTGYVALGIAVMAVMLFTGLVLVKVSRPAQIGLKPFGDTEQGDLATLASKGISYRTAIRSTPLWLLFAGILIFMMTLAGAEHYPAHLLDSGMSPEALGGVMSVYYLISVIITLSTGFMFDKLGLSWSLLVLWVGASAGWLVLTFAGSTEFALTTGIYLVIIASGAGMLPALVAFKMFGERDYPKIIGLVLPAGTVGLALAAPLWGLSHDLTQSYAPAFIGAVIALGVGLALVAIAMFAAKTKWGLSPDEAAVDTEDEPVLQ